MEWRSGAAEVEKSLLDSASEQLAKAVEQMWSKEAVRRGLKSPLTIDVRMELADAKLTAHPAQWLHKSAEASPRPLGNQKLTQPLGGTSEVLTLYNKIRTGRLVIVGEPGGGKTAAAVLLLLALCAEWRPTNRIPVLFSLASWRPSRESVLEWMADQLSDVYGTSPKLARALLEDGRVLPFFDGLDEMIDAERPAAIGGLRTLADMPLVLTCRTNEYASAVADGVVEQAAVLTVTPISRAAAATYLSLSGAADASRWDPVLDALRDPAPNACKAALSNPLMLSLARIVFQSAKSQPADLIIYITPEQIEDRLLDGLLPAVYGIGMKDTPPDRARRWLGYFADHLPLLGPGGIRWWRLPRCVPRWFHCLVSVIFCSAVGGIVGAITGLIQGAMYALFLSVSPTLSFALQAAVVAGASIMFLLIGLLTARQRPRVVGERRAC